MSGRKKILFIDYLPDSNYLHASGAGLGSSLFKLAAIADASRAGFETHLLTSPAKKELLEDASGIDFIYSSAFSKDYSTFEKVINLGISEEECTDELKQLSNYIPFTNENRKQYKTSAHLTFWRSLAAQALSYELPKTKSEIDICIESEDILKAAKAMPKKYTWIAVSYQSISNLKDYRHWNKVIELLLSADENIRVVLLGDKAQSIEESEKVLNLMGQTSIQLLKAVISQVDLLTGVDGLAANIAIALNKPSVILFTMISPENVIDDIKSDRIVSMTAGQCAYQYCYPDLINYRTSGCRYLEENPDKKNPECLSFTPESIVDNILKLLKQ